MGQHKHFVAIWEPCTTAAGQPAFRCTEGPLVVELWWDGTLYRFHVLRGSTVEARGLSTQSERDEKSAAAARMRLHAGSVPARCPNNASQTLATPEKWQTLTVKIKTSDLERLQRVLDESKAKLREVRLHHIADGLSLADIVSGLIAGAP